MKRFLLIFALAYALFFAIPFPMLIYYNVIDDSPPDLADINPWVALSLTACAVIFWIIVLTGYFRKWVLAIFKTRHHIEALKTTGVRREAKILSATKSDKPDTYELRLSFKNLADTWIVQKAVAKDNKLYEHRFEPGKNIELFVDKEMKNAPYFIFGTTEVRISNQTVIYRVLGWMAFSALVIGYFIFSYARENNDAGWRFIVYGHPLWICPLVLLFYRLLLMLIMKFSRQSNDMALIKFKGIKTTATVLGVHPTGTYINEQPMMRFDLAYTDYKGQSHKTSLKKVIGLLSLDTIKQESTDIFYLRDNPAKIAFADDLDNLNLL